MAVGGRPSPLECPGGELAISSDDIFSRMEPPGKTLCVGAGYVSLECGGFLAGIGYETHVMVRSVPLRGFDRQCADNIVEHMSSHGVKFIHGAVPAKIEKTPEGRLAVTWTTAAGGEGMDVYDTVLCATGRYADTRGLNLSAVGVLTDAKGKLICRACGAARAGVMVCAGLPALA